MSGLKSIVEKTKAVFRKMPAPDFSDPYHMSRLISCVDHGRRSFEKGLSFARWSDRMILNNGNCVVPYLREAWKHVKQGTSPVGPGSPQVTGLTPPPSGNLSALMDVVEKGKAVYYEGISYKRWYLKMTQRHGFGIYPYLGEAWKLVQKGTTLAKQGNQQEQNKDGAHARGDAAIGASTIMKHINWKTFTAGLACGLVLGSGLFYLFGQRFGPESIRQGRFTLIDEGRSAIKMDTRSGKSWIMEFERALDGKRNFYWKPLDEHTR